MISTLHTTRTTNGETMKDKTAITIEAVKEALTFINKMWGDWQGDFHDFMANVISDDRVSSHDVRHVLDALSKGEPIEDLEDLYVQKEGSTYDVRVKR